MAMLAGVGGTFLVLYGGALVVGLVLARSITRSVHSLSQGTHRLRRGDFAQPIPVQSRDQLGELADSFNVMARDIQELLRESAEKQRLEEELRIARQIQMSLLPQDTVSLPGLRIAAALPARGRGGRRLLRPARRCRPRAWASWWPTSPARARPPRSTWPS